MGCKYYDGDAGDANDDGVVVDGKTTQERAMANNYMSSSSLLEVDQGKIEQARAIIVREIEGDPEGYAGFQYEIEPTGIWFHGDDSIDVDQVAAVVCALIEELEIDETFYCSWAYTCSSPRIGEFGGGSFAVFRDPLGFASTVWVDADSECRRKVAEIQDRLIEEDE